MQGKTAVNLRRLYGKLRGKVEQGLGELKEEDWEAVRTYADSVICGKGVRAGERITIAVSSYLGRKPNSTQRLCPQPKHC